MDERFLELKRVLLNWGKPYIEEFIGQRVPDGADKAAVERYIDEAFMRMPSDVLEKFYAKFEIF